MVQRGNKNLVDARAGRNNPLHYLLPAYFSDGETETPKRTKFTWTQQGLELTVLHVCLESPLLSVIPFVPPLCLCQEQGRNYYFIDKEVEALTRRARAALQPVQQAWSSCLVRPRARGLRQVPGQEGNASYGIITVFLPLSCIPQAGLKATTGVPAPHPNRREKTSFTSVLLFFS